MIRVRSPRDLGAAITFATIGTVALVYSQDYALGTTARMGPGYMPAVLGGLLILFGIIVGLRALTLDGPALAPSRWGANALILGAIVLFGFLLDWVGLAPTIFVVAVLAAYATPDARTRDSVALGLFLALLCVGIFVYGLKQPLPVFGPG